MPDKKPSVALVMGSKSDEAALVESKKYFHYFNISFDEYILSAHRNPRETMKFSEAAEENGYEVIIAVAGMAAHLPGAIAAVTVLPVIGVPMPGSHLSGVDALHSIVQMPKGVPVATMAIGTAGAANAAIFSVQILALRDLELKERLHVFKNAGCKI